MALEIFLNAVDHLDELHVYIIERDVDGRTTAIARPMDIIFDRRQEGTVVDSPTLRIGRPHSQSFLKAWSDALERQGVKPESDAKLKGTLEATRFHLDDLRSMLKLPRRV